MRVRVGSGMEFHSSKEAATSLMRLLLKTHWFPTQIRPEYLVMASYIEHSPAYMSDFKSLFFQERDTFDRIGPGESV
jgi:hypothetical protein